MPHHAIVVGNVGTIYSDSSALEAERLSMLYVAYADTQYGRVAGEPVTWLLDGDLYRETPGTHED